MRRAPLVAVPSLALVLVLAGCGSPPLYSLPKTRACFVEARDRVTATPATDVVAHTAQEGTFRVRLKGTYPNGVTLSFADNAKDAQDLAAGYVRFHAKNVGVTDILFVDKNVVTLWLRHPTDPDKAQVTKCLK